jgi:hypothetical protein
VLTILTLRSPHRTSMSAPSHAQYFNKACLVTDLVVVSQQRSTLSYGPTTMARVSSHTARTAATSSSDTLVQSWVESARSVSLTACAVSISACPLTAVLAIPRSSHDPGQRLRSSLDEAVSYASQNASQKNGVGRCE